MIINNQKVSDREIVVILKSFEVFEKYGYKYPSIISQQDLDDAQRMKRKFRLMQSERSNEEKQKQT